MEKHIQKILDENTKRLSILHAPFNPITGQGAILERKGLNIEDFPIPEQHLPLAMFDNPFVKKLQRHKTLKRFIEIELSQEDNTETRRAVITQFLRIRSKYDFCFWAAYYIMIKAKGGGADIRFLLNHPQRRLIENFERNRIAGKPIRLILLKARQWGGSTATQIYMAWLQLVHKQGLNSLIVGHVKDAAIEVKDMFDRLIKAYPTAMLYPPATAFNPNEPKIVGVGQSGNIHRIPQRNCKIKIGTAEKPDSARGGDYNLVHCTEVGLWRTTEGRTPEQIVRSATSGVLLKPYTMIVYESTANGTGNFFHREYTSATRGTSQFEPMFVAWYEIEQYASEPKNIEDFAKWLYNNRKNKNTENEREESGAYLWWLWKQGATLQAIHWYIAERSKYADHGDMAAEFPSNDIEAFVHSGERVFSIYHVEKLRADCRPPKLVGDIYGQEDTGDATLESLKFSEDMQGNLWIWQLPEIDDEETVTDRYLTVVDIGGRSNKADYSVIVVFDRLYMIDGERPSVVAQWYGHIDMDLLAYKAAQIAMFYDESLLVIESNTIETHDRDRRVDGDQSQFLLNQIKDIYPNLYARKQSEEDIREGLPRKYGFHTNISTKPMVISTLVKVIRDGLYIERDQRCLDEYLTYERKQNGAFGAIVGKHDDLLMTRAIGLHICFHEMDIPVIVKRSDMRLPKRVPISEASI